MNARRCVAFVVATISLPFLAGEDNGCCPGANRYDRERRRCADEEAVPDINCTAGKYLVEPSKYPLDNFFVKEDGHLQIGEDRNSYTVPPDMFCITKTEAENDSSVLEVVAMVCFPGDELEERDYSLRVYFAILLVISVVFLFLTFIIYLFIPELRDLQGRNIMFTVVSQLFAYITLAALQFEGHRMQNVQCVFSAFFLYFWMLSSFFWLNIASFNVWRMVAFQRFPISDNHLFWCFFSYGWGAPLLFLITSLGTHHAPWTDNDVLRPNFGLVGCWFHGDSQTWAYFYGPISVLLAMNVVFFLLTVYRLWKISSCESTMPGIRSSRFKCILYLKLFTIMGILWIFEVLSFLIKKNDGFWYLTDTLNSLQGLFIFLIVVCRKRVLNALAKRDWGRWAITCLCPKRCTSGPDLEQEEAMLSCPGDDETYVAQT